MRTSCKLTVALALWLGLCGQAADAWGDGAEKHFDIARQSLASALNEFAQQSDRQILFSTDVAQEKETEGVRGEWAPEEALRRLLKGTGLTYRVTADETILVESTPETAAGARVRENELMRVAQAETGAAQAPQGSANGPSGQEEGAGEKLELAEVLVTATKRIERARDIPLSIAVINNQDIERRGLIGMEDYLRSIPGVNQIDNGSLSNAIVIRGITTSPEFENGGSGPTVSSYFDETPITAAAGQTAGGIDIRPVDIERIEVLRGPQGTAFGDGSLGGTLRVIPVKPKLDAFSARVAANYSGTSGPGHENSMIQGMLNLPLLADKFALRAVGYRYDESGFYRNVAGEDPAMLAIFQASGLGSLIQGHVQDDVGRMLSTGGRLAALWQPTDKLSLSLSHLTQKIEQDGSPLATRDKYQQSFGPVAPQARVRGEAGEAADTKIHLSNAVLSYDLGWGALTSVASWVDSGSVYAHDFSGLVGFPLSTTVPDDFEALTAEMRVASKLPGRFQFLAGVFYEDVEDHVAQTYDWAGAPAPNPLAVFGVPDTIPLGLQVATLERTQRALFGEISYALTEKLTATAGGRFFKYDKEARSLREGGLFGALIGAGAITTLQSEDSDSNFKANLSYKPGQDALVYASWAQGFRLGRPDVGALPSVCDPDGDGLINGSSISIESTRSIESDFLDNYELGGKFALLDRRMTVDASVYHIKWDGLPVSTAIGSCGFTANAGRAISDGAELQIGLTVAKGWRLDFGAGYTEAELSQTSSLGPDGARLPGSPRVNANLGAQYDFTVAGHNAFLRADSFYAGEFFGDLAESVGTKAGDYLKIDARAGVAIRNFGMELFVRNLTDEDALTWHSPNPLLGGYRLRPRTVGVQLTYNFE